MPDLISDTTITSLQALYTDHLMDEGQILKYFAGGPDEYGMPAPPTYAAQSAIACSFRELSPIGGKEAGGEAEIGQVNVKVGVPLGTIVTNLDKFKILKLHGTAITPIVYEIAGPPKQDALGIVLDLKLETDGSDADV